MSERVSVIIAVYNRVGFLQKCLLSLNCQSRVPDEVIIADDGSDVDMIHPIEQMADALQFEIIFVRQAYKGFRLAKSKNNGIRQAGGSFLIFNDQDVIHTPHYIRTFLEHKTERQFLVAYPARLTETQTGQLSDEMITNATVQSKLISKAQIDKIHKQYYKDAFEYNFRRIFRTRGHKPKLRGGIFGIHKANLLLVNGFDENYEGWGNEDDDLGRRLYRAGIVGRNPFYDEYPIHLWHPPHHQDGKRINQEYYHQRIKQIDRGQIRAVRGLTAASEEEISVIRIK